MSDRTPTGDPYGEYELPGHPPAPGPVPPWPLSPDDEQAVIAQMTGTPDSDLRIVPVRFADACGFVTMWHRHHGAPVGCKFCIGVADGADVLRGVAIVGRPVARHLDNGLTLEVTRTATDGTANANSMLYGAAWRAAKALGYRRLVTYTQDGESGASLRAVAWRIVAERPARPGWTRPSRPRQSLGTEGIPRTLWEAS